MAGAYNFGKLMALKESDWKTFLVEAEYQIKGLWHGMEALSVHNDLFRVKLQIAMGKILNVVKGSFKKHSDFTAWVKATFPDKTMRYFQQARQLDRMGDFARIYASIGKNRLLEFDRLRISVKKDPEAVLKDPQYPLLDTSQDGDGVRTTEKIDGIITHKRFKDQGIEVDFDVAVLMACFNQKAVEVGLVKRIKGKLEESPEDKDLFSRIVMDKLVLPDSETSSASTKAESLNKLLAQLDSYRKLINTNDARWVKEQRTKITEESLLNTFSFLKELIRKLGVKTRRPSVARKED